MADLVDSTRPAGTELLREELRGSTPVYQVTRAPCRARLNANESPFALPDPLHVELMHLLATVPLHRYPDPEAAELRSALAERLAVAPSQLVLGNGSDDLIKQLLHVIGGPVVYPTPTFAMYELGPIGLGLQGVPIPLDERFQLSEARLLEAIERESPRLIFLPSPNNPTGNLFSQELLLRVLAATSALVVVDEAYERYAGGNVLGLLPRHENLAILRTFSKIGLAGLRIGYLIAHTPLAQTLNLFRLPYNVGVLSQAAARFFLAHDEVVAEHVRMIVAERRRLQDALGTLSGITAFPSQANFILFRTETAAADAVFEALLSQGVLVRKFDSAALHNCLRVTVGTGEENDLFLEALRNALAQAPERVA